MQSLYFTVMGKTQEADLQSELGVISSIQRLFYQNLNRLSKVKAFYQIKLLNKMSSEGNAIL